jgi:hypothetical protein
MWGEVEYRLTCQPGALAEKVYSVLFLKRSGQPVWRLDGAKFRPQYFTIITSIIPYYSSLTLHFKSITHMLFSFLAA